MIETNKRLRIPIKAIGTIKYIISTTKIIEINKNLEFR